MSWNDMMKRLVMGKQANKNYSKSNLPRNRKQVFKFAYKQRGLQILTANLIACLFALPFIVFELLTVVTKRNYKIEFATATDANAYALSQYYLKVPFLMLASIGFAGVVYVIRKICWDEPVSVWKDFAKGVKNSWGKFLVFSFLMGVFMYLLEAISNILLSPRNNLGFMGIMGIFILGILLIVGAIFFVYAFALSNMYSMSFWGTVRASFLLTFKKLFSNLLMLLCGFGPILLLLILCLFIPYFDYVFIGLLAFGLISYMIMIFVLFTNRQFDVYINGESYPDYVNKGIYDDIVLESEEDEFERRTEEEIKSLAEKIAGVDKIVKKDENKDGE